MQPSAQPPQQKMYDAARFAHAALGIRVANMHLLVRDLGLKYHSLPLELRREYMSPDMRGECDEAFHVKADGSQPDILGMLDRLHELKDRAREAIKYGDFDSARIDGETADEVIEDLRRRIEGLDVVTERHYWVRRYLSTTEKTFPDDALPQSADRFPNQPEHYQLLRAWVLFLRESKTALEMGFSGEDEIVKSALSMDEERFLPEGVERMEPTDSGESYLMPDEQWHFIEVDGLVYQMGRNY